MATDPAADMRADILVIGAGMAGLAAAAAATGAGARVVVLEKAHHVGGSAAMSVGMFWAPPDLASLRRRVPLGDPELGRVVVESYPAAVERIRALGVRVGERVDGVMTVGTGHSVDVAALLAREVTDVERGGGRVLCGVAVKRLLVDAGGTVRGAQTRGGPVEAAATIIATGGFQGDPELRARYLGSNADRLVLRANPGSVGDGLRMGRAAGAATSHAMASFYGHLLPNPVRDLTAEKFIPLAQYHSSHCILVNVRGRRFCDESTGDEVSNQLLLAQPEARGVLLCDERIRTAHVVGEPFPGLGRIDRFAYAADAGARYVRAGSVGELVAAVAAWGVDPVGLRETLDAYAAAAAGRAVRLDAPLPAVPQPLAEPPLHALEVVPAITFTYGGLRADTDGRVLDHDGVPVAGLWVAGVDAGGLSNHTYAGGLAPAYITGVRAGVAATISAVRSPAG
jgi:succinate dehydrogenase/fumarate reductase flavoprotein subunit